MIETFACSNVFVAHTFYFKNLLNEHTDRNDGAGANQTAFEIVFHSNANQIVKRAFEKGRNEDEEEEEKEKTIGNVYGKTDRYFNDIIIELTLDQM